ncbi:MAG: hypothetical protein EOM30_00790 [Clostridia bacterium]|nr:hypothetical protein [Clostridia bacterium]
MNKLKPILAVLLAALSVAACLFLPAISVKMSDETMYNKIYDKNPLEGQLSQTGRDCLLASMLYAQTHVITSSADFYAPAEREETAETTFDDSISALINAGVIPSGAKQPQGTRYKAESGMIIYYSTDEIQLGVEATTGKVTSFAWEGEQINLKATQQAYLEYLEIANLENADWHSVKTLAGNSEIEAVYSAPLQLYVSVTEGSPLTYHALGVTSMTKEQLAQITVANQ